MRSAPHDLQMPIPVGQWVWMIPSDIVYADRNLARFFGVSEDAALAGLPISQFLVSIHENDKSRVRSAIDLAVSNGARFQEIYQVRGQDGQWHKILATGHCFKSEDSPLVFSGWLAPVDDIADGKVHTLRQMQMMVKRARTWSANPAVVYVLDDVLLSLKTLLRRN